MDLQPLFRKFHEAIKLRRLDENAELTEKRDRVLKRLREGLKAAQGVTAEPFNQGSYAMNTGIKPLDGDYDIDVGVILPVSKDTYPNPLVVKQWVYDAVKDHTQNVQWRRNCITVFYRQGGEPLYHVDLPVFAKGGYGDQIYLAVGKQHSGQDQRMWQPDDRRRFIAMVEQKHQGEDGEQFRRVIRCLKRWKDEHFAKEGWAAPTGNALTVAAFQWFSPVATSGYSQGQWRNQYNDLEATRRLVDLIRGGFGNQWTNAGYQYRISLVFPVAPGDDVFSKMSGQQMQEFKQRLDQMSTWLVQAGQSQDPTPLKRAFGRDFPVG